MKAGEWEATRRRRNRTFLRRRLVVAACLAAIAALIVGITSGSGTPTHHPGSTRPTSGSKAGTTPPHTAAHSSWSQSGKGLRPGPNLAPGSDPAVLPSDVLIADEGNNRLVLVNPAGKVVWVFPGHKGSRALLSPDDAFFARGGKQIMVTEEDDQVISLVSVAKRRVLWRYGTPGVPGSGPNQLSNPDDAMLLPNGDVFVADIKNCSLLLTAVGLHSPLERIGIQDTHCWHSPPLRFGSPNGAFPLTNGNYLVTEINGDWADEISLSGKVLWSTHPPGVTYPSDTNEVSPGRFVTVDYSRPGQIVEFNRQGHLLWRYGPSSGPGRLNTPSLCEPIPTNGDFLCNDDGNDRVIVVNPRTNRIVWQYGHDGVPGSAPGYLSGPDGVDLAPPYSLLLRHGPTMGLPKLRCAPGLPAGACTIFHR